MEWVPPRKNPEHWAFLKKKKTVQALKCNICLHQHDVGCAEEEIYHREGCQVGVEGRLVLQQARAAQDQQGSQVAWEL